MKLLERFFTWWRGERPVAARLVKQHVLYPKVQRLDSPPADAQVRIGEFILVEHRGRPKWVLFRCPCSCGQVITLSLQPHHRPFWRLNMGPSGTPSLKPSVWRDTGCRSHFFIREGSVVWALDEGARLTGG